MSDQNRNTLATKRIIVADQNQAESSLLKIFLAGVCDQVSELQNGQDVVDSIVHSNNGELDVGVVILNQNLLGIDGIEATCKLRSAGFSGPIIGISSEINRDIKQAWSEAGCDDFLQKPITRTSFADLVKRLADCI